MPLQLFEFVEHFMAGFFMIKLNKFEKTESISIIFGGKAEN